MALCGLGARNHGFKFINLEASGGRTRFVECLSHRHKCLMLIESPSEYADIKS